MKTRTLKIYELIVVALLLSFGIPDHSFAQGWYNVSWKYRKTITIDHNKVPNTDQSNFPMLVSLTTDADLIAHARSDGFDILFTSSDEITKIPYQRESYLSGSGTLLAWVQVPTVSHTANTFIYMYYGNSTATDQSNATGVWTNSYAGVYHLDEAGAGTAGEYKNATGSANNGTVSETVPLSSTIAQCSFTFTTTSGGNDYRYVSLTSPPVYPNTGYYTVTTGDLLVYDVYWTTPVSDVDRIAIDFQTSGVDALRNYSPADQNGLGSHPAIDLSNYALNKWYRRVIPLPAALNGQGVTFWDVACEHDGTGTITAYLSNICIVRAGVVIFNVYSDGGANGTNIPNSVHINNPATSNSNTFTTVTNTLTTPRSVTSAMFTALNADATRYVGMGASATTQLNNWTLEAWVNPNNVSQHGYFVFNGNDGGGYGIGMGNGTGAAGSNFIGFYGGSTYLTSGSVFSSAGSWYHVVMARDAVGGGNNGTARFYLNGSQTTSTYTNTPSAVPAHLTIASELNSTNIPYRLFNGVITEVRISNTVRSADWIATEFNNQSSPSTFYAIESEICHVTATVTATQNLSCYGMHDGAITVSAGSGTSPYYFSIDNGASWYPSSGGGIAGPHEFTGLNATTTYKTRVKDSNGCLSPQLP